MPLIPMVVDAVAPVPVVAAVSVMEAARDPYIPISMTLMGGPIDTRRNPAQQTQSGCANLRERWLRGRHLLLDRVLARDRAVRGGRALTEPEAR